MSETTRATWDFLPDTYWYVTHPDLPALQFSADSNLLTWGRELSAICRCLKGGYSRPWD